MVAGIEFQIVTEDSGKQADKVLGQLILYMCRQIEPSCETHRIKIQPLFEGRVRDAARANKWQSDEVLRKHLVRSLGTAIESGNFVVLHYDGDTCWSKRKECRHTKPVNALIADIKVYLTQKGISNQAVDKHFLQLIPYYSIESWLYLNQKQIEKLIEEGIIKSDVVKELEDLRQENEHFDEVIQPKKKSIKLKDNYNEELAMFQRSDRLNSPSFQATCDAWRENTYLRSMLNTSEFIAEE